MNIIVLHYKQGSSNKIWAIDKRLNANNTHDVWYGKKDTMLTRKSVSAEKMRWYDRVQKKIYKGYREVDNVTIDNKVVIPLLQETEEVEEISTSLWYRIRHHTPIRLINDYLNITIHLLSERHEEDLETLKKLPIFLALQEGKMCGGVDYKEGPLALMLLFGLRRYLKDVAFDEPDLMHIANDMDELLPERFADITHYVEMFCESLFTANGWMSNQAPKASIDGIAQQYDLSHYTSKTGIQSLSIAMGCIDAPIDLTVIRTEKKAAFF